MFIIITNTVRCTPLHLESNYCTQKCQKIINTTTRVKGSGGNGMVERCENTATECIVIGDTDKSGEDGTDCGVPHPSPSHCGRISHRSTLHVGGWSIHIMFYCTVLGSIVL